MPVEPTTYRIKRFDPDPDPEAEPVKFSSGETFLVDFEDGYAVVKDSRLQAIADAWNEPHVADSVRLINSKFADVMDAALTEENSLPTADDVFGILKENDDETPTNSPNH